MTGTYIISAQNLVRNNQHVESGRGGYLESGASTTEGQLVMLRGLGRAYEATGDAAYIEMARRLGAALLTYFAFGIYPSGTGAWASHWVVNAGDPFNIKGPVSPASPNFSGVIAQPVTFTGGVATLPANLSNVYLIFDNAAQLIWSNVFSLPSSGATYDPLSFVDRDGFLITYDPVTGYWSGSAAPVPSPPPGTLTAATALNGTYKVNYAVYEAGAVARASMYEAWPMWRFLEPDEWAIAADTVHWGMDAFDILARVDPTHLLWADAKAAEMRNWLLATTMPDGSYIFQKRVGERFNSVPLTYFYIIMFDLTTRNEPTDYLTYVRDGAGYVVFTLPADANRQVFVFENNPLFMLYDASSRFYIELATSIPTTVQIGFSDQAGAFWSQRLRTAGGDVLNVWALNINGFKVWDTAWRAGDTEYSYIYGSCSRTAVMIQGDDASDILADRVTIGDNSSGMGVVSHGLINNLPVIRFATVSTTAIVVVLDANHWRWDVPLPVRTTATNYQLDWSAATFSGFQEGGIGDVPTAPVTTAPWLTMEFKSTSSAVVDLCWVALGPGGAPADALSSADRHVAAASVQTTDPAALTLRFGDCRITEGVRQLLGYYPGVLPFQFASPQSRNWGAGPHGSGAPYIGPPYLGYQGPAAWLMLGAGYDDYEARNLLFMVDAQNAYAAQSPGGLDGPYAPVYLWATWDSTLYGPANNFTWEGPDPNTFWGGFQYRAFLAVADYWHRCAALGKYTTAAASAAQSATRFMNWMEGFRVGNPTATSPAYFFYAASVPYGEAEAHMCANALKGVVYSRLAGADEGLTRNLIQWLYDYLKAAQVQSGPMQGSFSPDPAKFQFYGFWAGEIMDALALLIQHADRLQDINA